MAVGQNGLVGAMKWGRVRVLHRVLHLFVSCHSTESFSFPWLCWATKGVQIRSKSSGRKKKEEKYKFSKIDNYQVQNECPTSKLLPTAFIIKNGDLMIHLSKLPLMYSPLK